MTDPKEPADYVKRVLGASTSYTQELLAENIQLRQLVKRLRSQVDGQPDGEAEALDLSSMPTSELVATIRELEAEREELTARILIMEQELKKREDQKAMLERQLHEARREVQDIATRYRSIEKQATNLANLYVSSYRLLSTLDKRDVAEAIKDIIVNLIGSEQLVVLEADEAGEVLHPLASMGIDESRFVNLPVATSPVGRKASAGRVFVAQQDDQPLIPVEDGMTACIPLKVEGRLVGAVAVYSLLAQKSRYTDVDFEMFELLATHAATALHASALHARHGWTRKEGGP